MLFSFSCMALESRDIMLFFCCPDKRMNQCILLVEEGVGSRGYWKLKGYVVSQKLCLLFELNTWKLLIILLQLHIFYIVSDKHQFCCYCCRNETVIILCIIRSKYVNKISSILSETWLEKHEKSFIIEAKYILCWLEVKTGNAILSEHCQDRQMNVTEVFFIWLECNFLSRYIGLNMKRAMTKIY